MTKEGCSSVPEAQVLGTWSSTVEPGIPQLGQIASNRCLEAELTPSRQVLVRSDRVDKPARDRG